MARKAANTPASNSRVRGSNPCRAVKQNPVSETEFQNTITRMAEQFGWMHFHVHDSRRSVKGWPDLVLLKNGCLVIAELKREGEQPTPAQRAWLAALGQVRGITVKLWRPSDWPEIERVLTC